MQEESLVRQKLMDDPNYRGYCGNWFARHRTDGCDNPRTEWVAELSQFKCPHCGWVSQYPQDFIDRYKAKHNL